MNLRRLSHLLAIVPGFFITCSCFGKARTTLDKIGIYSTIGPGTPYQTSKANSGNDNKISAPQIIHLEEPRFSKMAKKSHIQGRVLVNLVIGTDGTTENVHMIQVQRRVKGEYVALDSSTDPIAKDIADAAIDAVGRYKFKPAMKNGSPTKVELHTEVPFDF
jgi:outer membrane biosynthesis protein TonB